MSRTAVCVSTLVSRVIMTCRAGKGMEKTPPQPGSARPCFPSPAGLYCVQKNSCIEYLAGDPDCAEKRASRL